MHGRIETPHPAREDLSPWGLDLFKKKFFNTVGRWKTIVRVSGYTDTSVPSTGNFSNTCSLASNDGDISNPRWRHVWRKPVKLKCDQSHSIERWRTKNNSALPVFKMCLNTVHRFTEPCKLIFCSKIMFQLCELLMTLCSNALSLIRVILNLQLEIR